MKWKDFQRSFCFFLLEVKVSLLLKLLLVILFENRISMAMKRLSTSVLLLLFQSQQTHSFWLNLKCQSQQSHSFWLNLKFQSHQSQLFNELELSITAITLVLIVLEISITTITTLLMYLKNQSHQSRTFEKQSQQSYQSQNFRHTWSFQSRKYNCRKYSRKSIIHNH